MIRNSRCHSRADPQRPVNLDEVVGEIVQSNSSGVILNLATETIRFGMSTVSRANQEFSSGPENQSSPLPDMEAGRK